MSGQVEHGMANRRVSERIAVVLGLECLLESERPSDVWLIDLSPTGCQLFASAGLFQAKQDVVLLHAFGDSCRGRVAWAHGMKAGVMFDLAQSNAALRSLLQARRAGSSSGRCATSSRSQRIRCSLPGLGGRQHRVLHRRPGGYRRADGHGAEPAGGQRWRRSGAGCMSTRALPEYARIAADVLIDLSSELERLGAGLCGDPHLVGAHMESLQGIDRIVQTQRSLATVLGAPSPDLAVEELVLEDLRQKMLG